MKSTSLIPVIKPYTNKELSSIYGVCDKTFKKWLLPFQKQIGEKNGHFYTAIQVKTIMQLIGVPEIYNE